MYSKDTARLSVQFRDFDGYIVIPENVKLAIYDTQGTLKETFTEGIVDSLDGSFYYDYTATDSDFIFEYLGYHFSKPVLARQLVQVKFN